MPYPSAVATTAQGLFTIILATLTIMLSSCDVGGGGGGENNLLEPDKISISGSISDSLKSTFDVDPASNNYELYSRYIGSAQPTAANAKATDVTVTDEDIKGTIVVLAVDQDYNVYTTNTDSARKFNLAIPPDESYVIIFVSITGKQVGILVHQEALVTASYKLDEDVDLGEVTIIKTGQAQAKSAENELLADYDEEKTKDAPKNVDEIEISDKSNQTLFLLSYLALPTGSYSYVVKQGTNNYQHLIKYYKQVEFKSKKYLAEVIVKMCETTTKAYDLNKCSKSSIEIQNMYLNEFTSEVVKTAYIFDSNLYHSLSESRELPLSGKIGKEVKSTQDKIKYRVKIEDVQNKSYDGIGTRASVSLRIIATDNAGKQISDQRYWYAKNIGLIQQENPNGNLLPQEGKTIYVYNTNKSEGYGSKPNWFTDSTLTSINKKLKDDLKDAVSASGEMKISYAGKNAELQIIKSYINSDHRLEIAFRTNKITDDSKGTVRLVLRNFATNNEFKAALDGNSSLALKWASALEVYDGSSWQECGYDDSTKHFFEVSWRDKQSFQFSISSPQNIPTFNCGGKTLVFTDGTYRGTYTTKSPFDGATSDSSLAKPINLKAKEGDGKVNLTWGVENPSISNYYDIFYVYYYSSSDRSSDSFIFIAKVRFDPGTRGATITDLTNDTRYYFVVTAIKDGVESLASDKAYAIPGGGTKQPPSKPTNLVAIGVNKGIDLSWNAVTGATSYKVYYSKASFSSTTDSGVKSKTGITKTNTSITGLTDDTTYYFRVIASNAEGSSAMSLIQSATTKASATTNLQAPTKLKATGGDKIVAISWNAVTGATSYKVYYSKASFSSTTASGVRSTNSVTTTNTSVTGLTNGTKYYFRVIAINASVSSTLSQMQSATTKASATTKLPTPTIVAVAARQGAIDLSWGAVTGATNYKVYYHTKSFSSTTDSVVKSKTDITTDNTSITGLADDTTYYFRVIASNAKGSSALSQIQSATTKATANLQAPTNVIATARQGAIDLTWDAATGATSYKVYYHTASFGSASLGDAKYETTDTTSISITDLYNGTTYYFKVIASNAKGDSVLSSEVSAITELPAPTYLRATGKDRAIDLSWGAVTGATSYKVYYRTASFSSTTDSGVISITGIDTTNTSITGLANDTTYYFRVIASNPKVSSALSQIQSATTKASASLQPPTNVIAIAGDKIVDISWKAVAGATSYAVYYHTASFSSTTDNGVISITGIDTTSTSITGLADDTTYYFRVIASNPIVSSALSQIRSATTNLEEPTNVTAAGGDKAIDISWDAVVGATSYAVYYHTASFSSTTDNGVTSITGIYTTSTSITGLLNGTKYFIRIVASNRGGDGRLSSVASAITKLSAPINLQATGKNRAIDLSWNTVTGATSYKVYYRTASFSSTTDSGVRSTNSVTTTKTSITGLTNGTKYYLRVEAINTTNGDKKLSAQVIATTNLNLQAPTNVIATGGDKFVIISWDAVTGATSYKVYYHTTSFSSTARVPAKTVQSLITSITGLTNGTKYYLRVEAINADGDKKLSTQVIAFTNLKPPTNLKATGGDKTVAISWNAVTGADNYKVYYSKATFSSTTASGVRSTDSVTTTNTSITGLTGGTKYYLRVEAINTTKGDKKLSTEIVTAFTYLEAPTKLKATIRDKIIDISWNAVTGATSYKVYYRTASFSSTTASGVKSTDSLTTTNTSITGLTNGIKYYLRVEAINAKGDKKLSTQVSATPKLPAPHPSTTASIDTLAAVVLIWEAVAGVTNYKIYYAKVSLDGLKGGYKNYRVVGGKAVTITDTSPIIDRTIGDLSADTTYYFVVTANYKGGEEAAAPEVTADSSYIAELAVGSDHGCVRLNTGSLKCWGSNHVGQLGVDDKKDRKTATNVYGNLLAKQISAGGVHSCAIDLEGRLYCWGHNYSSQLGLIGNYNRYRPTLVTQDKLTSVSLVSAGRYSTCALAASGNYCWGSQNAGGLGNGKSSGKTPTAQKINDITPDVKQFALGYNSGCAIDASDDLWCWGHNGGGQVGNGKSGNNEKETSPVKPKLKGGSKATMLDGTSHYCVVDNTNKVQCWGSNFRGQLGINSGITSYSNSPQYVLASRYVHLSKVSKIATGVSHSCALIIGGKVRCWGGSDNGQIGAPWQDDKKKWGPDRLIADTDMPDINNAIDIAAGNDHTCVLLKDKVTVKCWGWNGYGKLGNGGYISSSYKPVAVKGL